VPFSPRAALAGSVVLIAAAAGLYLLFVSKGPEPHELPDGQSLACRLSHDRKPIGAVAMRAATPAHPGDTVSCTVAPTETARHVEMWRVSAANPPRRVVTVAIDHNADLPEFPLDEHGDIRFYIVRSAVPYLAARVSEALTANPDAPVLENAEVLWFSVVLP
jgi:hypothetical protein